MGEYGICTLSIVPVRAEASDRAELTTQLIFGDLYQQSEKSENAKWIKITTEADDYSGWIDAKQSSIISKEEFNALKSATKLKTTTPLTKIIFKDSLLLVAAGSTLYADPSNSANLYGGESTKDELKLINKPTPDEIIPLAQSYLNTPYLWGGKTHFGIDCSGFVQQVYGINGYKLPRDAWQQEQIGAPVGTNDIKPGDLAFFKNDKGRIVHVGIMVDKTKIIHASGQVRIDSLDEKGIFKKETNEYTHILESIKRLIT